MKSQRPRLVFTTLTPEPYPCFLKLFKLICNHKTGIEAHWTCTTLYVVTLWSYCYNLCLSFLTVWPTQNMYMRDWLPQVWTTANSPSNFELIPYLHIGEMLGCGCRGTPLSYLNRSHLATSIAHQEDIRTSLFANLR